MTEDHPAFPCTVYGGSKLAGECYARAYYRDLRLPHRGRARRSTPTGRARITKATAAR